MTEENQNFTMYSGDAKLITVTVEGLDMQQADEVKWVLKQDTITVKKDLDDGITINDSSSVTITLDPADTEDIQGSYKHEMEITDAGGNPSTVMRGTATINKDIIE